MGKPTDEGGGRPGVGGQVQDPWVDVDPWLHSKFIDRKLKLNKLLRKG